MLPQQSFGLDGRSRWCRYLFKWTALVVCAAHNALHDAGCIIRNASLLEKRQCLTAQYLRPHPPNAALHHQGGCRTAHYLVGHIGSVQTLRGRIEKCQQVAHTTLGMGRGVALRIAKDERAAR